MQKQFHFDDELVVNRLGYGTMQLPGKGVWAPQRIRNGPAK